MLTCLIDIFIQIMLGREGFSKSFPYQACSKTTQMSTVCVPTAENAAVNFYLAGALTDNMEGRSLSPIGSLKESGVLAITDCPHSTQNNEIFVKGVEYASMFDLPVIDLPRELSLSKNGSAHDSVVALSMGLGGYPRMAEEIFVQRSITVSKYLDAHIHLSSISSKGSVELINDAKNKSSILISFK